MYLHREVFIYALSLLIQHKTNGLYDSHGVSGETFFCPRLKIEYVGTLGFCWSNLDEPCVFNSLVREWIDPKWVHQWSFPSLWLFRDNETCFLAPHICQETLEVY
jgi:hypothetical protein